MNNRLTVFLALILVILSFVTLAKTGSKLAFTVEWMGALTAYTFAFRRSLKRIKKHSPVKPRDLALAGVVNDDADRPSEVDEDLDDDWIPPYSDPGYGDLD